MFSRGLAVRRLRGVGVGVAWRGVALAWRGVAWRGVGVALAWRWLCPGGFAASFPTETVGISGLGLVLLALNQWGLGWLAQQGNKFLLKK